MRKVSGMIPYCLEDRTVTWFIRGGLTLCGLVDCYRYWLTVSSICAMATTTNTHRLIRWLCNVSKDNLLHAQNWVHSGKPYMAYVTYMTRYGWFYVCYILIYVYSNSQKRWYKKILTPQSDNDLVGKEGPQYYLETIYSIFFLSSCKIWHNATVSCKNNTQDSQILFWTDVECELPCEIT